MTTLLKKLIYIIVFVILLNNTTAFAALNDRITDYHQTFFPCFNKDGDLRITIRMYYFNMTPYYVVVNPMTFATEIAPATNFKPRKIIGGVPGYFTMQELLATPYMKALSKYTSPPYKLDNYGIAHAETKVNGVFLTADMCPSVKYFEKNFFNTLVVLAEKNHKRTPIALSITGLWIIGHPDEFDWLIKQINKAKLQIIWINHSFSHVYSKQFLASVKLGGISKAISLCNDAVAGGKKEGATLSVLPNSDVNKRIRILHMLTMGI